MTRTFPQIFRDIVLAVGALSLAALALHQWIPDSARGARLVIANATARRLAPTNDSAVQFMFVNRGDRQAQNVRLRILVANAKTPKQITPAEDFSYADPLDPGNQVTRAIVFRHTPSSPPANAAPGNGAANANATAAADAAQAAVAPDRYFVVLQADYENEGSARNIERRWYFTYLTGEALPTPVSKQVKDQLEAAVVAALNQPRPAAAPAQ